MTIKLYGHRAPVPGDRQVPELPVSKAGSPPIQTDRFFRNGKYPDATAFNEMNAQMNQAMVFRTKEAFSFFGACGLWPTGFGGYFIGPALGSFAGTTKRWRGAFHTGPYHHALLVRVVMCPPHSNFLEATYATLKIYSDASETTLVSTTEFYYGSGPSNAVVGGWQYHKFIDKFVEGLTADTDYYLVFSDENYGRLQSCSIADLASMTENYGGYLPTNFTEESQILDEYRQNLVAPMPALWKRGGAKVLNWNCDPQFSPRTIAVNTATNLLDGTSTTYGAAIPGYTLDMTGKNRLSQTGCPCVMKVHLSCTSAANGVVHLRDSAGTIVATCTNTYGAGVSGWISSAQFNLSSGKHYLTYQTAAGTLSVRAASIYEYEA
jgi:hypothetical protein